MSYSYGRYLLACVWIGRLFGVSVQNNPFIPESEETVTPELLQLLRDTADQALLETT